MRINLILRPKLLIQLILCFFAGSALLAFGIALGLNSHFAIFGPLVGFATAFFLVFGKKSLIPLMLGSALAQFLIFYREGSAFTLETFANSVISCIFFTLLFYLNAKNFNKLKNLYDQSSAKRGIQFFFAFHFLALYS